MSIQLVRVFVQDAEEIWKMQVESFMSLYEKYQDTDTSPATEKIDKVIWRLSQPNTYFYKIIAEGTCVGAIRIIDDKKENIRKRISPLFILPSYRGKGYATACLDYAKVLAMKENCYKMMLLTGSKKESTLKFYKKAGYNSNDKTAFIMWL